jgi:hypothetical protein
MKNDTINKKKYINIINSNPIFKDTNVLKKIYSQRWRCSRKKIFSVSIQDGGIRLRRMMQYLLTFFYAVTNKKPDLMEHMLFDSFYQNCAQS